MSFQVNLADSVGRICTQTVDLTVLTPPCGAGTDWLNPGACRLRIQGYFDGMFDMSPCADTVPDAGPAWDGTLPVWDGVSHYSADPTQTSISGIKLGDFPGIPVFHGAVLTHRGAVWQLNIAFQGAIILHGLWLSTGHVSPDATGLYNSAGIYCVVNVPSLTLEGY